ncbi:MAG TPA: hypothetical protein DEP28_04870 [Bacteroidetes bacterium]|nr:hypothetical protein [Bacteroidota bacterium]HCN36443.1 hypothetical protein [Bacteroidota bacterium]
MKIKKEIKEKHYQEINYSNFKNNYSIDSLKKDLKQFGKEQIRPYIINTVDFINGEFVQTASAPNLEGELITLCTCKHNIRTSIAKGKTIFIAGITSKDLKNKNADNYLFYLIKVGKITETQYEFGQYLKKCYPETFKIKSSVNNPLGDLFEFNKNFIDSNDDNKFNDPKNYIEPCSNHSHASLSKKGYPLWHKDIMKYKNNTHKLIIGEIEYSYVWSKQKIKCTKIDNPISMSYRTINEFFEILVDSKTK